MVAAGGHGSHGPSQAVTGGNPGHAVSLILAKIATPHPSYHLKQIKFGNFWKLQKF